MSNQPWQNASNCSALVASLLDLEWGCFLSHRSLWILVLYDCHGRPYPATSAMFLNPVIVVKNK